jgi:AAA15 family ATPase/GTPase
MSYIGRCQLSGYKSIKNVSCEFNKGLNIIIGNNGSGKTNLLEFIYKILKRDYSGLDVFNAEIQFNDESNSFDWKTKGEAVTDKLGRFENVEIKEQDSLKTLENYIEFIRFSLPKEIPLIATEYNWVSVPVIFKDWLLTVFYSIDFKRIDLENDTNDNIFFEILSNYFVGRFDHIIKELSIYTPVEDIRISNSIRIVRIDSSTFEFRNIVLEYKINTVWFSWDALSDGTKRLIYMLFTLQGIQESVYDGKHVTDVESNPIVFIEEPEIGIHPHQLHLLMTFLKEKAEKQQIIITTHSPQVLDVLSADELHRIFVAEIDYENGTSVRKLTEKETEKAKLYLQDEGMLSDYWRFSDFQRSKDSK